MNYRFGSPTPSRSSLPFVPFLRCTSILATLVSPSLFFEGAIAQPTPPKPSSSQAQTLTTVTFDFPHPLPQHTGDLNPPNPPHKTVESPNHPANPRPSQTDRDLSPSSSISPLAFQFSTPPTPANLSANPNQSTSPASSASLTSPASLPPQPLTTLFSGDSNSLVARAIGCAEGTRSPDGGLTWAYNGHTDPGNGVWNMGTFSWQHGATSPEEADRKQLARLKKQAITLTQKAEEAGIAWGLEEQLNGLDLANQSPSAALNPGGYIDRLKEAQEEGLKGSDAILWARTWSYRHPSGTRWNAPGLGNTHHGIRTDQKRRQDAIQEAIAHFGTI